MRYWCKCGKVLSNSANPEIDYRLYSAEEWNDILNDDNIVEPILIPYPKHSVWVCPECKRAYVWRTGDLRLRYVYKLEE